MKIVPASITIETELDGEAILKRLEKYARTCYKSEEKIGEDTAIVLLKKIIKSGHHAMLEHESISVRFICDRGVSHELVRHRIASFAQESTRYCNYSQEKFGKEITVIDIEKFMDTASFCEWQTAIADAEKHYFNLIKLGNKPQIARSVLPNSLKTEIVITCNIREWRHFFNLRTAETAHPQMREVARPLLRAFREQIPLLFDDVGDLGSNIIVKLVLSD